MDNLSYIHKINSPSHLKKIPLLELPKVCAEYRSFLINTISKTGGHLGASLGAVELNVALHYLLDSPKDKICWDVGHQAYVHKMITGRRERLNTIRQAEGISGFPSPFESPHDQFIVGHACTAISQGLGLAVARDLQGGDEKVVVVVGDGALTGGLAYEALNNAGHLGKKMLIILNDNEMSISKNVGAISKYLNKVITNPLYNRIRTEVEKQLRHFPRLRKLADYGFESFKHLLVPGLIFEELGFRYFGPVDGHGVVGLVKTIDNILKINDVCLLHVVTQKGKGYEFAEKDAECLHGVTPFNVKTGEKVKSPSESKVEGEMTYTQAFAQSVLQLAREDKKIVAITAAMPSGTGLDQFAKEFPGRFFDVGIAEQHAVTFAGALAKGGLKPVCAIYSTFLQRSQDQLIHDVALQKLNVTLCLDRAGLVGADGATHNGVFDISYLGHIPNTVIAAPKDNAEMFHMLKLGVDYPYIFAMRYPRAHIPLGAKTPTKLFEIGEGEILREGSDVAIFTLGSMIVPSLKCAELLAAEGIEATVCNLRFAQPLDEKLILEVVQKTPLVFTAEEHVLTGGFGSKVLEFFERKEIQDVRVKRFALPNEFIEHGSREKLLDRFGLSSEKMAKAILETTKLGSGLSWHLPTS
ncbi:MAG: 1-deoxy-D-xylulose-5-phosphate synthase [Candidatus Omnitrophica bacterium]|nr:1-deoxy-D-xylulose-5-phosphate synthase [Candidatus Omnitrophota bacterium]